MVIMGRSRVKREFYPAVNSWLEAYDTTSSSLTLSTRLKTISEEKNKAKVFENGAVQELIKDSFGAIVV